MKKFLFILLVLACTMGMLMASGEAETAADAGSIVNPKGEFPIVDEPITLTLFTNVGDEVYGNGMTEWYEEKTGIIIEWIRVPRSNYNDKLKIKLNTQDLPDIIRMEGMTGAENYKYIDEGFFYPISDLYDEWSEYTHLWQETDPDVFKPAMGSDGKTYGWPWRVTTPSAQFRDNLFVEKSWLEAVGMDVPTTTEEFYQVLKAFKAQDANNNGDPNDEIPYSGCTARALYNGPIMTAFALPGILAVDNGDVYINYASEEYKNGLIFMNKLWEEGLIYPEAFTQDRGTQWKVNEANEDFNAIGSYQGQHFNYAMNWESDRWKDYTTIPTLAGPDGTQYSVWSAPALSSRINTVISATTEHPEAAFRFVDWLQSQEGALTMEYGLKDVHYRDAKPGEVNNLGTQATYTQLDIEEEVPFAWGTLVVEQWGEPNYVELMAAPADDVDENGFGKWQLLEQHGLNAMPFKPSLDQLWPSNLPISSEVAAEYGVLKTNVEDLIRESATAFIMGKKNLTSDWDDFQKKLKDAGAEKYLEMSQDLYDTYYK